MTASRPSPWQHTGLQAVPQAEGAVSHGIGCAFSKLFAVNLILHYHTLLPS